MKCWRIFYINIYAWYRIKIFLFNKKMSQWEWLNNKLLWEHECEKDVNTEFNRMTWSLGYFTSDIDDMLYRFCDHFNFIPFIQSISPSFLYYHRTNNETFLNSVFFLSYFIFFCLPIMKTIDLIYLNV